MASTGKVGNNIGNPYLSELYGNDLEVKSCDINENNQSVDKAFEVIRPFAEVHLKGFLDATIDAAGQAAIELIKEKMPPAEAELSPMINSTTKFAKEYTRPVANLMAKFAEEKLKNILESDYPKKFMDLTEASSQATVELTQSGVALTKQGINYAQERVYKTVIYVSDACGC